MQLWKSIIGGIASTLSINASPLYRYPYRNGAEAFRGDTRRIAGDMEAVLDKIDESPNR